MREKSLTELLRSQKIAPKKSLGQNFLTDPLILGRIAKEADISRVDTVLEIGPGPGTLTQYLVEKAGEVIAVELDDRMVNLLRQKKGSLPNLSIIHKDILELDLDALMGDKNYLAVANVPYYITSAIFRHLLNAKNKPSRIIFTIQKEVAERICELDGEKSLLSLSIQVYGAPRILFEIPSSAFKPSPKVDSAVLRVDLYEQPLVPEKDIKEFFRLTKAGFSQKRKTLKNALSATFARSGAEIETVLAGAGINPIRRAETLSIEEWRNLIVAFAEG